MTDKFGTKWLEDEIVLAFYYYCRIPFGKIHKNNPMIIDLARKIGRTPSSVALKMVNLGHFDPTINAQGMSNASKLDKKVVQNFMDNWDELAWKANKIEQKLEGIVEAGQDNILDFPYGGTIEQKVKERMNQQFFRNAVLSSYNHKCCITGITVSELLIASHIKPWKVSDPGTERTNPSNGLCLNALHDKAFDRGLITIMPDYTIRVSSKLKEVIQPNQYDWFTCINGGKISLPERFLPEREFLEYHNDIVFIP